MRKTLLRFVRRVLALLDVPRTYQADFDDVGQMVATARALRAEGYGARTTDTPLRLLVTVPRGALPIPAARRALR